MIEPKIHLSQAAELSRRAGPPLTSFFSSACQIDIDARLSPILPGEPPVTKPRHPRYPGRGFFLDADQSCGLAHLGESQ